MANREEIRSMKSSQLALTLAALAAVAAATPAALAVGPADHKQVIVVAESLDDADPQLIDIADLEVGEARQVLTEGGKEVVITRVDEGYDIALEGKTTKIRFPDVPEAPAMPEGAAMTRVIVEKHRDGDGPGKAIVYLATDALDDDELKARVVEILSADHGDAEVVIAPDGKRVKRIRVIRDDSETVDGEEQRDVVILRKRVERAEDDGKE
jgi:hypothetical protein